MAEEERAHEEGHNVGVEKAKARLDWGKIHHDFPKSDENYAAWYRLVIEVPLSTDKKVEYTGTIVEKHGHVGTQRVPPRDKKKGRIPKAKRARKKQKARSGEISDGDGHGEGKDSEEKETEDSFSSVFLLPDVADEFLARQRIHQLWSRLVPFDADSTRNSLPIDNRDDFQRDDLGVETGARGFDYIVDKMNKTEDDLRKNLLLKTIFLDLVLPNAAQTMMVIYMNIACRANWTDVG